MSNWIVVGMIGIVTIVCCIIVAKFTGNARKSSIGGIFALLSAGAFGYTIAYFIRKGLTGPYLTVAVLVGIIVPVLIFLTVYTIVKENHAIENHDEEFLEKKLRLVEEDKKNIKAASVAIEEAKRQYELDKAILEKDKVAVNLAKKNLIKEKKWMEEERALLEEGKLKTLDPSFAEEKERMRLEFEEERAILLKNIENENKKLQADLEEAKRKIEEKEACQIPATEVGESTEAETYLVRMQELNAKEEEIREEREDLNQMLRELNLQQRKMKEDQSNLSADWAQLQEEKETLNISTERLREEYEILEADRKKLEEEQVLLLSDRTRLVKEQQAIEAELDRIQTEEKRVPVESESTRNEKQEQRLEEYKQEIKMLKEELEVGKENLIVATTRIQEVEKELRMKVEAEAQRKQEANSIQAREMKHHDFDNMIEKGRLLRSKGLCQLAITLYEEFSDKLQDENQKQLIRKEMADCYMDSGEVGKARRLLAKR